MPCQSYWTQDGDDWVKPREAWRVFETLRSRCRHFPALPEGGMSGTDRPCLRPAHSSGEVSSLIIFTLVVFFLFNTNFRMKILR